MDTKFHLGKVLDNLKRLQHDLPKVLANDAQNFFAQSFKKSAWEDGGTQNWPVPQRRIPGTSAYKYPKTRDLGRRTRATLVKTGALRRAAQNSIREATYEQVRLVIDLPYAQIHNTGGQMPNGARMPRRKFMGDSRTLRDLQRKKIIAAIDKTWQR